ncbi:hypothetical protein PMAYCL1PPCAC_22178, partial [Pristionchus mayeri]
LIVNVFDVAQVYCFMNNSLSHVSLAFNRLFATVLFCFNLFSKSRTVAFSIFKHLLAITIANTAQHAMYCCRQVLDYNIFNFRADGAPDYGQSLKTPIKIAGSTTPFLIYSSILIWNRVIARQLKLQSSVIVRRRQKELRFAIQFATIAVLYTLSWSMIRLMPPAFLSSLFPGL